MDASRQYMVWLADAEFAGGSFNGPSLIETLQSLSPKDALSTETYEGYSAWGVALHVLYFKYLVGKELGADMPDYRYDEKDWPEIPESRDKDAYDALIAELSTFHKSVVGAFAGASPQALEAPMPGWKVPLWKAFAWLVSHDTNHNTQIRNMGIVSLREK